MIKYDDYILFVNMRSNNMILFLCRFIEMKTGKTVAMITEEYLKSVAHGYQSFLNFMKNYAASVDSEKIVEKYINVKSFEALCVRSKL